MAGGAVAHPDGAVEELMLIACEQGNVTPDEFAEILGVDELVIEYDRSYSVGNE